MSDYTWLRRASCLLVLSANHLHGSVAGQILSCFGVDILLSSYGLPCGKFLLLLCQRCLA
ncbi:hypothetical protein CPB84DRAFT_1783191 [Gymnopilus junonius]|uniref:Uncharacterized protein n=1 Tax=Gymnopilus junonius TaxID=109634 RepID=A0A9P5TMB7_GYMJU|nr:hypothetical protein CPB84DRAFT_1783191 [Gymnopilus junonius]